MDRPNEEDSAHDVAHRPRLDTSGAAMLGFVVIGLFYGVAGTFAVLAGYYIGLGPALIAVGVAIVITVLLIAAVGRRFVRSRRVILGD